MLGDPVPATFDFTIFITGLVIWRPLDGQRASFLGVRTQHHAENKHGGHDRVHAATLTYVTRGLSGFGRRRVAAPDPLVASPTGPVFARRVLNNEILWLQPDYLGAAEPLSADVPDLLQLRELDPRVTGIRSECLGPNLDGTPAVSRLDVAAGRLTAHKSVTTGPWSIRGPNDTTGEGEIDSVASILKLELTGLRALTIFSNKNPALRLAGEGHLIAGYSVEPITDSVPSIDDHFPHFEMAFGLATWEDSVTPSNFRKPYPVPDAPFTLGDRACPPAGG